MEIPTTPLQIKDWKRAVPKSTLPTILLGMISYREVSIRTVQSIYALMGSTSNKFQWDLIMHVTANIPQGRSVISRAFLGHQGEPDYLMFVDQDMVFTPEQGIALIEAIIERPDAGIVAGMYTKRDQSLTPLVGWLGEEGKPLPTDETINKLVESRGKVVEADILPTGFMVIRKEAFEGLTQPFFYVDWPWKDDEDPQWRHQMWSSDNVFCRDVREKTGLKTYGHLGVEIGHIGEFIYEPEMFYQIANQMTTGQQLARLKTQAADKFGVNTKDYWDVIWGAEHQAGIERQYTDLHNVILQSVVSEQKVLDMGSGPGILAQKLKAKGCEVHCRDISEFAVRRCEDLGFEAKVFDLTRDRPEPNEHRTFDVVIATEVLEHLEDVDRAIKTMNQFLKPGGLLIISTPNNCLPPEEEIEHVRTVTTVGMAEWLRHMSDSTVLPVNNYLVGLATKPLKEKG